MIKTDLDFDMWNEDKKRLQNIGGHLLYLNNREIWYTKMGINIGY